MLRLPLMLPRLLLLLLPLLPTPAVGVPGAGRRRLAARGGSLHAAAAARAEAAGVPLQF